MFGPDEIFGQTADNIYLPKWRAAGDESNWLQLHCDARGGHSMVIGSGRPRPGGEAVRGACLIRDREVERRAHDILDEPFFNRVAPARRSFHAAAREQHTALAGGCG